MIHPLLSVEIRFENDVVAVRQRARQISGLLGFDELDQARIATAVSEIARNALNYARGGEVTFQVDDRRESTGGLVLAVGVCDRGRGIADLDAVLEGRRPPRAGQGPGLGIPSARRLMDEFQVESAPGQGTTVTLGKKFPRARLAFTPGELARLRRELSRSAPQDPLSEIRQQNQELVRTMEELRARQDELVRLNRELEDTNRGVVALYAELDEKASHLKRADELKTRFLSDMSHEFRTPLNSILALSRILLECADGPLTEEQSKQIAYIQKNAQDLSELVNDLLDLAKVEAGRVTVTPAETDCGNLFAGLRGIFRPLATNPAVSLVFQDPGKIPPLLTDEGKVSQILRNFISNALKFTEQGEVSVAARYDPSTGLAAFSVRDTGIGIAPEDQARIFEEFTQLDNPLQRRVKGTGLGLPLSRKLAELLGGRIWLESRSGAGSTFFVAIPRVWPGAQPSAAPAPTCRDLTRFPLLVIEDEDQTVLLYEKYLKGTGYQVLQARTAAQAHDMLASLRPAAIVLDILLPGGGGWDLLADLKRQETTRDIPLYVVSVLDEARRALALGADDYCTKPMDRKWLLERLRQLARHATREPILVVDDDEVSRYVLKDLLADSRYRVLEAATGREALQVARDQHPAALLLDLVMPEMSGFEVLDRLRADPATRDIPVIIVTSKKLGEEERLLLSQCAVAILSKETASRQQSVAQLREALNQAQSQRLSVAKERPHGP